MSIVLTNARLLMPDSSIQAGAIGLADGRIAWIDRGTDEGVDVGGQLVLPGIVDLHGDAFERQLMPRPGVHFAAIPALIDTDRQMLANGITTAYHGLTLSWEPGLRGIGAARAFMAALAAARDRLRCDTRLHLRFETFNLDCVDEVLDWIGRGQVDLLAFNEHTRDIAKAVAKSKTASYQGRTGLDEDAFLALFHQVRSRAPHVDDAMARLASAAMAAAIPLASHDDESESERSRHRGLGCHLCEFPLDQATARAAVDAGDTILLGAPNIMRGGSHAGRLDAAAAAAEGLCAVLTSDYYYPAMLYAAFELARRQVLPLSAAWNLISRNPAQAVGLTDRGTLAEGNRADIVLVDDSDLALPVVVGTLVHGKFAFLDASRLPRLLAMGPRSHPRVLT